MPTAPSLPARSVRALLHGLLLSTLLATSGCISAPRNLPHETDVPKAGPLPIDGVWRLEENQKRYRIEGRRIWIMDPLVVGLVRMDPGQVAVLDLEQTSALEYTGNDIATVGKFTAVASAGSLKITVETSLVPVHYTMVPVELDDPAWFGAQLALETILARAPSNTPSPPPPPAGAAEAAALGAITEASGDEALSASQRAAFGRYHALVIGNNAYRDLPRLTTAIEDAQVVSRVLRDEYGFQVTLLEDATRAEILTALRGLRETLTPSDNLLIYYAGHGWLDEGADEGYWLPVDAQENSDVHWISNSKITGYLRSIQAKHVMVVADSCYSGTLTRGIKLAVRDPGYLERIAQQRARIVLSSGGLEPVADGGGGNHSAFARHFIDELHGNQGVMDSTTLYARIRRPVMLAADQAPELADIRKAGHEGGDFLFIRAGGAPE